MDEPMEIPVVRATEEPTDEYCSETIEPPKIGSKFTKVLWPIHRFNAPSQDLNTYDYKTVGRNVVSYKVDNYKVVRGASCFVPLNSSHNYPNLNSKTNCYFLQEGTILPDGLAIVYTKQMTLKYPPKDQQNVLHFNIFPTKPMTINEFSHIIKNLDWQICKIKASVESDDLIEGSHDLDDLYNIEIISIYLIMMAWYEQNKDPINWFHANEINTWISLCKHTFQDFINDEFRCWYVFAAVAQLEDPSCPTLAMYYSDLRHVIEKKWLEH